MSRTAAAKTDQQVVQTTRKAKLTSIRDLAGIPTGRPVPKLRERRPDLAQRLGRGAVANTLVLGQGDLLDLAGLGVLHLGGEGDDLVVEPAGLLRLLGAAERLRGVAVLVLAGDVEVRADVLGRLAHRLHAVGSLLVLDDLLVERPREPVAIAGHDLGAHRNADVNRAQLDLVRDVLHGFQAGRAEPVHR